MNETRLYKNAIGRWEIRTFEGTVIWEVTSGDVIEVRPFGCNWVKTRIEFDNVAKDYYALSLFKLEPGMPARKVT